MHHNGGLRWGLRAPEAVGDGGGIWYGLGSIIGFWSSSWSLHHGRRPSCLVVSRYVARGRESYRFERIRFARPGSLPSGRPSSKPSTGYAPESCGRIRALRLGIQTSVKQHDSSWYSGRSRVLIYGRGGSIFLLYSVPFITWNVNANYFKIYSKNNPRFMMPKRFYMI